MLVTNLYFQTPMNTVTVPSPGVLLCVIVESTNDTANWSSVTRRPRPWPRFTHSALRRLLVNVRISEEKFTQNDGRKLDCARDDEAQWWWRNFRRTVVGSY